MSYGLPLWYKIDGKGCKAHLKMLTKTQNVTLRWITGAFCTTPIAWMEYIAGIPPVKQKANYMLRNTLQWVSKLPSSHILNSMAAAPPSRHSPRLRNTGHSPNDNIWLIKKVCSQLWLLDLLHPVTWIGNRLLDCTDRVTITIPAAPPHASKVFDQWAEGWMRQCYSDAMGKIIVGSDGSYKIKGQGTSTFIIQMQDVTVHSDVQLVVAHSSYDAEMSAAHNAIVYLAGHHTGHILFFINNQATIKSLFNTKPHSAFELSKDNCQIIGDWLSASPTNRIEIRWMPSHLGFGINEMADSLADQKVTGPAPFPAHNIASRIRHNRSLAIQEWRAEWRNFATTKALTLKKKKKAIMPHAWDSNGKQFVKLAEDITLYS